MPRLSERCDARARTRDPFKEAEPDGSVRCSHLATSFGISGRTWLSGCGDDTTRRGVTPRVFAALTGGPARATMTHMDGENRGARVGIGGGATAQMILP